MINLKKLYEERGLTIESNEFPDYLPMFLEFLSGLNDAEAQALWTVPHDTSQRLTSP